MSIDEAILYLKSLGYTDCYEHMGILVIPVFDVSKLSQYAGRLKKIFKEIGYEKSWSIISNPHYFERKESVIGETYGNNKE